MRVRDHAREEGEGVWLMGAGRRQYMKGSLRKIPTINCIHSRAVDSSDGVAVVKGKGRLNVLS
jgi:hypothetical protein